MVAPSTAPTVPDRPPAAPDPVTGITMPKTHVPYDFTSVPTVPDRPPAAPDPVTGITLPKTHVPYDFTSELQLA